MSNKMSNKDKERLLRIIEYLKINESIKKSEAAKVLNVEDKTAQRLLVKATTLEILKTEGDYKTTVYKSSSFNAITLVIIAFILSE